MSSKLPFIDETRNEVTIVHFMQPWLVEPGLSETLRKHLEELVESGTGKLLINLEGVTRLTSVFIRSFIAAGKKANEQKARMAFCNLQPLIKDGFSITGMDKLFKIYGTEPLAMADLAEKQ